MNPRSAVAAVVLTLALLVAADGLTQTSKQGAGKGSADAKARIAAQADKFKSAGTTQPTTKTVREEINELRAKVEKLERDVAELKKRK